MTTFTEPSAGREHSEVFTDFILGLITTELPGIKVVDGVVNHVSVEVLANNVIALDVHRTFRDGKAMRTHLTMSPPVPIIPPQSHVSELNPEPDHTA